MGRGDAEVHRARRRAITEEFPEVQKLTGPDSTTQWYAYGLVVVQLAIAYYVRDSWAAAIFLGATFSPYVGFGVFSLIHEASHSLIFSERWALPLNRILGIFTNMVVLAPVSEIFRQHHNMHHLNLGDEKKDVDVPSEEEVKLVSNSSLLKAIWLTFGMFILSSRSVKRLPVKWNRWVLINWVCCLGFSVATLYLSLPAFIYLLMGLLLSQSIHPANARQVQRHIRLATNKDQSNPLADQVSADGTITFKKCTTDKIPLNTFSYYGWMNAWSLNVGYHVEHHDFGNVAWTRLPTLRKIAGEKWYPATTAYSSRGFSDIVSFVFNPDTTLADFAGRG